jgi:hypothetical protein
MKVVINKKHGGFNLSKEAVLSYGYKTGLNILVKRDAEFKNITYYYLNKEKEESSFYEWAIERDDLILIEVIEQLGDLASNSGSELKIVEIPDDIKWYISDFGGLESIHECHRSWE